MGRDSKLLFVLGNQNLKKHPVPRFAIFRFKKIKSNSKLNENLEKHPSPRFVIFHHTWRHPQLLLVPATISNNIISILQLADSIQRKLRKFKIISSQFFNRLFNSEKIEKIQ